MSLESFWKYSCFVRLSKGSIRPGLTYLIIPGESVCGGAFGTEPNFLAQFKGLLAMLLALVLSVIMLSPTIEVEADTKMVNFNSYADPNVQVNVPWC